MERIKNEKFALVLFTSHQTRDFSTNFSFLLCRSFVCTFYFVICASFWFANIAGLAQDVLQKALEHFICFLKQPKISPFKGIHS